MLGTAKKADARHGLLRRGPLHATAIRSVVVCQQAAPVVGDRSPTTGILGLRVVLQATFVLARTADAL